MKSYDTSQSFRVRRDRPHSEAIRRKGIQALRQCVDAEELLSFPRRPNGREPMARWAQGATMGRSGSKMIQNDPKTVLVLWCLVRCVKISDVVFSFKVYAWRLWSLSVLKWCNQVVLRQVGLRAFSIQSTPTISHLSGPFWPNLYTRYTVPHACYATLHSKTRAGFPRNCFDAKAEPFWETSLWKAAGTYSAEGFA